MGKRKIIGYCEEQIREANIALGEVRDVQRKMMNAGANAAPVAAQIIGLRERIAAYRDIWDRARKGKF